LPSSSSVSRKRSSIDLQIQREEQETSATKKAKVNDDDTVSLGDDLSDIENRVGELLSPQKSVLNNKESEHDYEFEEVLKQLSDEVNDTEDKGPPVIEKLGKCMSDIWAKPLSKERYMEKLKAYKIPQNVNLNLKRCNPEIWNNTLSARQKTFDLKLQKIQNAVMKTNACTVSSVNDLMLLLKGKHHIFFSSSKWLI